MLVETENQGISTDNVEENKKPKTPKRDNLQASSGENKRFERLGQIIKSAGIQAVFSSLVNKGTSGFLTRLLELWRCGNMRPTTHSAADWKLWELEKEGFELLQTFATSAFNDPRTVKHSTLGIVAFLVTAFARYQVDQDPDKSSVQETTAAILKDCTNQVVVPYFTSSTSMAALLSIIFDAIEFTARYFCKEMSAKEVKKQLLLNSIFATTSVVDAKLSDWFIQRYISNSRLGTSATGKLLATAISAITSAVAKFLVQRAIDAFQALIQDSATLHNKERSTSLIYTRLLIILKTTSLWLWLH